MNSYKENRIFSAKKAVVTIFLLASIGSCNSFIGNDSIAVNVVDPGRDTVFSIPNQKLYDAVNITLEGNLSDTSVIAFSTDSTFTSKATYFASTPKVGFSEKINLKNIKSDSLFIKYHTISSSNLGDVKIGVSFY